MYLMYLNYVSNVSNLWCSYPFSYILLIHIRNSPSQYKRLCYNTKTVLVRIEGIHGSGIREFGNPDPEHLEIIFTDPEE